MFRVRILKYLLIALLVFAIPFVYFGIDGFTVDINGKETKAKYTSRKEEPTMEIVFDKNVEVFNYFTVKYTSDAFLKCELKFKTALGFEEEEFFLEDAPEQKTFQSFIKKNALSIKSMTVTPLNKEKADFKIISLDTEKRELPDDYIYIQNDEIKIGVSLKWGGALAYYEDLNSDVEAVYHNGRIKVDSKASEKYGCECVNSNVNLINRHDTGRLIQQSYYGTRDESEYTPGVFMKQVWSYNPVQGGNQYNESSEIVDYKITDNSIYIKCRPLDWAKSAEYITPSYMEATYTLKGKLLKVDCRFTDFSGYSSVYKGQELPAFYPIEPFNTLVHYEGDKPGTNDKLSYQKDLGFWAETGYPRFKTTEKWSAFVGEFKDSFGLGLYSDTCDKVLAGVFKRDKTQNADPSVDNPTSYIAITQPFMFQSFVPFEYSFSITSGTAEEMRNTFLNQK